MNYLLVIIITAFLVAPATYFFLLRSEVKKAALSEAAKKYGGLKMRKFMGMPQTEFSEKIMHISPSFCEIFEQAECAQQDDYKLICGLGYGKALEFLVKDYAIFKFPLDVEMIKKSNLSECIKKHSVVEIRDSADVARLLRNDQTHYERSYLTHGSRELKTLILLMISLIEQVEGRKEINAKVNSLNDEMKNSKSV